MKYQPDQPRVGAFSSSYSSLFKSCTLVALVFFCFSCMDDPEFSSEASLTSLTLTVEGVDYQVKFTGKQGTITVPYSTKLPGTATVETVVLSAKATGVEVGKDVPILASGRFTLTVTAEDGTTEQVYTILVKKEAASSETAITSLTLTVEGTDYQVDFTDEQAMLTLYGTAMPATVSVASVTLSLGATGVKDNDELPVRNNTVKITVTAENGTTIKTYTVTLVESQAMGPLFTSFTFTTEDNEAMALEEEDRKEIVGTIDNDANTITFTQQGAYVYRNRLKAAFTTSDGATVQVGDMPQTSGVTEQDFTSPVNYVVRVQDGAETTYTVTLLKSTMATIEDDNFRTKLQELVPEAFTGDQLNTMHNEVLNNNGELDVSDQNSKLTSLKGIEFFKALTTLDCSANRLTSLDVSRNTALTTLDCSANRLTSLDMMGMRSVTRLNIGTGTGEDNPLLATLRVNTAVQDRAAIITMKTARRGDLTITTVDDGGTVVCADYSPVVGGGRCGSLNNDANITALTLTVGSTDYLINFVDRAYTLTLPEDSTLPTIVRVESVILSPGTTGVAKDDELVVTEGGIVTLEVLLEDGATTQEYTVTLVVPQATGPRFISFTFTPEDNEAMALDADDRKEIVGSIDNDANSIIFVAQSAYVYLNRLKATFTTSDGATVQVGDMPQTSGVTEQDFTLPVNYVVRAEDGAETAYTVTLAKSTMATIPDDQFRKKLKEFVPAAFTGDQLDITHENVINNNDELDVSDQNPSITSLKGIEFFRALTYLDGHANDLTSLDVRKNTALTFLDCSDDGLTSLDVSEHTALTTLVCSRNRLSSLDVNANTALEKLSCDVNRLSSLDVSANTALEELNCDFNRLTSLDVSANTALTDLNGVGNRLTSLDMTGMRSIVALRLGTGIGENSSLLETLRVNTAVQDNAEIIRLKTNRGEDLTITTVDDEDMVVCDDYNPIAGGGRCGPLSNDAGITSLKLSVGDTDYDVIFVDTQGSVTLSYGTVIPATVVVKETALSPGATGVEQDTQLNVVEGKITLTVTAEDGETEQAYTVTLSVAAPNDEASIISLKLSVGDTDYDVIFADTQGGVTLSYGTAIPATVVVKETALSPGATGVEQDTQLNVVEGKITLTVTAEDGETEQEYTVTLSVAEPNDEASIISLKLSVGDTDYDVIFADTQGDVTLSYGTVIPATVVVKETALSPGATGVERDTQLNVVEGKVTLTVTAEDGETEQAYTVTLSVAAPNDEASIISLKLSVGDTDYDVTFADTQGGVTLSYGTAIPATVEVKETELSPGATGIVKDDELPVEGGIVTITVTAEDGETEQAYTVTLSVAAPNDEASLISLKLSVGDTDYDVIFENTQGGVTLSYGTAIPATVGVKETELSPGATGIVKDDELPVEGGIVTITVTAEDGETEQAYTVTLSVAAPNDEASITDLTLNAGGADYEIDFTNRAYTLTLPEDSTLPTIVRVESVTLSSGATGIVKDDELPVEGGIVTITVTAEDGETEQEYTVTLSVAVPNDEASLISLKLSVGDTDYDVLFENTQGSVIVPYGTAIPATVGVKETALSPGATGIVKDDELPVEGGIVTITVTAEDGETEQEYTVTLSVGANDEASIISLKLSVGDTDYDVLFENTQGSVTLSYGTVIPATVGVKETALSPGATGIVKDDELPVEGGIVTITVTAEDGETEQEYTVTLSVGANDEASLISLKLSVGDMDYDVIFADTQGGVTLSYGTVIPATVGVKETALSPGATGIVKDDELPVEGGIVTITVTAEDGITTKTYTVTLSVGANDEASITDLTLNAGGTDYEIDFTNRAYTLTLPENSTLPTIVRVESVTLSPGATGIVKDDELPVEGGIVTITVTAENGETEQEYTVTLVVLQATDTDPLFTSFTFTPEDNEAMALDVRDRKEIVGTIDNDANTIDFAQQSAYVYLNNLKASFTTSNGATVQVESVTQTSGVTEQDFTSPVSYVVRARGSTETTTYTVTLTKSNKVIIPDAQFRMRLQQALFAAFEGNEMDISHVSVTNLKNLNVDNRVPPIASLKGIEFFTGLTKLRCSSNALDSLDFRKNANLITLTCKTNTISVLNVTQNRDLTDLNCQDNALVSLDVSKNTALTDLDCSDNSLTSLDVSENTALIKLTCNGNLPLSSLDVGTNKVLEELICSNNSLTTLDLRENKDLKLLSCGSNGFTSLDVSQNKRLSRLICSFNTLTSLDVRQNTDLQGLDCGDNTLASLDVSKNTNLIQLICGSNQFDSLDVSLNTALRTLRCQDNSLTFLDMTGMRTVSSLLIGRGTNGDNLLERLKVNVLLQDHEAIRTMKTNRGEDLTITTVNDAGEEQCANYIPAENGGNCQQAP